MWMKWIALFLNISEYNGVEQKDYGEKDGNSSQIVTMFYIEGKLVVLIKDSAKS